MNKLSPSRAQPLAALVSRCLSDVFAKRGFAAAEIVTRWPDIAGTDIAAHCEPIKIEWPRRRPAQEVDAEPGLLVLRVEGPCAIEIQHQAEVIVARVNRFFGWSAIGRVALRQAPLRRAKRRPRPLELDPAAVQAEAERLSAVGDDDLRAALARLGASVKRG